MIEIDVDVIHHGSEGSILEGDVTFRFFFYFFLFFLREFNMQQSGVPCTFPCPMDSERKTRSFFLRGRGRKEKNQNGNLKKN